MCNEVGEAADLNPVAGSRGFGEPDPPPVAERDAETSPEHRLYKFVKLRSSVNEAIGERFADVLGNVACDAGFVLDEFDVDDERIAGDSVPSSPEIRFRNVKPVDHAVDVDVPSRMSDAPFNLGERTATKNSLLPEGPFS